MGEAAALIDEAGVADTVGILFDTWHLWDSDLEADLDAYGDRIVGVHVSDVREPTRSFADRLLPGDGVADIPRLLGLVDRAGWDGFYELEIFSDNGAFGLAHPDSLWDVPTEARQARARRLSCLLGAALIERVCVVGAGVIGSLYAAHLARVTEVDVLCRREEHTRFERARPARVGAARVRGRAPRRHGSRRDSGRGSRDRRHEGDRAGDRCRGTPRTLAGRSGDDGAERIGGGEIVRRHGDWPLISAVTFMSGTRHEDTLVEYILDTETWLGPFSGTPQETVDRVADLIVRSGLKARAFADLRPAQWSKLIFNSTVNSVAAVTGLPHDPHFAARRGSPISDISSTA